MKFGVTTGNGQRSKNGERLTHPIHCWHIFKLPCVIMNSNLIRSVYKGKNPRKIKLGKECIWWLNSALGRWVWIIYQPKVACRITRSLNQMIGSLLNNSIVASQNHENKVNHSRYIEIVPDRLGDQRGMSLFHSVCLSFRLRFDAFRFVSRKFNCGYVKEFPKKTRERF